MTFFIIRNTAEPLFTKSAEVVGEWNSQFPKSDGPNIACGAVNTAAAGSGMSALSFDTPTRWSPPMGDIPHAYARDLCWQRLWGSAHPLHHRFAATMPGIAAANLPVIPDNGTWLPTRYGRSIARPYDFRDAVAGSCENLPLPDEMRSDWNSCDKAYSFN